MRKKEKRREGERDRGRERRQTDRQTDRQREREEPCVASFWVGAADGNAERVGACDVRYREISSVPLRI